MKAGRRLSSVIEIRSLTHSRRERRPPAASPVTRCEVERCVSEPHWPVVVDSLLATAHVAYSLPYSYRIGLVSENNLTFYCFGDKTVQHGAK